MTALPSMGVGPISFWRRPTFKGGGASNGAGDPFNRNLPTDGWRVSLCPNGALANLTFRIATEHAQKSRALRMAMKHPANDFSSSLVTSWSWVGRPGWAGGWLRARSACFSCSCSFLDLKVGAFDSSSFLISIASFSEPSCSGVIFRRSSFKATAFSPMPRKPPTPMTKPSDALAVLTQDEVADAADLGIVRVIDSLADEFPSQDRIRLLH